MGWRPCRGRGSIWCVSRRATLRASDNDREVVAERLRAAAAEGRIVAEELEERLASALRARTYGELDALVADLPREQVARRGGTVARGGGWSLWRMGPLPALAVLVFVMPIAVAAVVAVMTLVFAMVTMWAVFAALIWLALGHSRRWYGPRWAYARRRFGPPPRGVYRPRPGYWH